MDYEIRIENGKAKIFTPYNKEFVAKVKLLGARWDGKCWSIGEDAIEDVREAMRKVYGRDDREAGETVDVMLTFRETVEQLRGSVTLLGRTIASAFGRDSGARIGEGVRFIEGSPKSAGSMKNWYTEVPEGCKVKLGSVPKSLTEDPRLPDGVEMEILGERIDRAALEAEKAELLARIAEIDSLLKGE